MKDTNDVVEPSKDEVVVKSSSLPPEERDELEKFLEAQPEVESVAMRMKVRDSAPGRDTIGSEW
jgi:hypothetical protein